MEALRSYARLILAVLAVVVLLGAYAKGRSDASGRCDARIVTIRAELATAKAARQAREREANAKALDIAHKQIAELEAEKDELAAIATDNAIAAAADARANDPCLGIDSVRRLNRFGGTGRAGTR